MRSSETFPSAATSSHDARLWAMPRLLEAGMDGSSPDALVVLTELVDNAITHGRGPIGVSLSSVRGGVRVEVSDRGGGEPTLQFPGPDAVRGRGLIIVDKLAHAWGVEVREEGKLVWAEVPF